MNQATVTCVTCKQEGPTISGRVPFRGALKEEIVTSVCGTCWSGWIAQQLKIINEYRLNLAEKRSHDILQAQVREFLHLSGATAAGTAAVGPDKARELGNL